MSEFDFEQDRTVHKDGEKQSAESSTRLFQEACNCAEGRQGADRSQDGKIMLASAEHAGWTRESINAGLMQGLLAPTWTKEKMNQGLLDRLKK